MKAIEIKNLTIKYGKTKILEDINLKINANEIVSIFGNNGSGKTTLINAIISAIRYKGQIEIFGKKNTNEVVRENIAFVPQISRIQSNITVWDYVSLAFYGNSNLFVFMKDKDKEKINHALKKMNIYHLKDKFVSQISGGEMQKASLALGLVYEKPIIVLDEPFNHLDLETKKSIENLLISLKKEGKTIIVAMHDINIASGITNRFIVLKDKKIVFDGKPNELLNEKSMIKIFNIVPIFKKYKEQKIMVDIKETIKKIYVKSPEDFLTQYKSFTKIVFKSENFVLIEIGNKKFALHKKDDVLNQNIVINLENKKEVLNLEKNINKIKNLTNIEKIFLASGFSQIKFQDKFKINWNFKYEITTSFFNIYSSQLPALLNLGFKNIIQREQRERNYFATFIQDHFLFKYIDAVEYHQKKSKQCDYVVADELDKTYQKEILKVGKKILLTNYGWNKEGQSNFKYENETFKWSYKNDPFKQYLFLVNSLAKEKLIDKKIALELGKKENKNIKEVIERGKKELKKYQGKKFALIFHWISNAHYFEKKYFDKNNIVIMMPSFLPWLYEDFKFSFPEINNEAKNLANKYALTDFENKKLPEIFNKSFDIILYVKNKIIKTPNPGIATIKKLLKPKGKLLIGEYDDFNEPVKSFFGVKVFLNNVIKKLK